MTTVETTPRVASSYAPDEEAILYQGEAVDLLQTMPSGSARLIVTSPPYNLGKQYETAESIDTYLSNQESVIAELVRLCANDGSISQCVEVAVHDKQ